MPLQIPQKRDCNFTSNTYPKNEKRMTIFYPMVTNLPILEGKEYIRLQQDFNERSCTKHPALAGSREGLHPRGVM